MAKAYKVELLIIDTERMGEDEVRALVGNIRHLDPEIKKFEVRDIGEWDDDHLLNSFETADKEYERLFGK